MSRAIKKFHNGISVRYIKKTKRYYLTYGVMHILVDGKPNDGFNTPEEAELYLSKLQKLQFWPNKFISK